ncbi:unnamed protein product [Closterium sp. NIES-54]
MVHQVLQRFGFQFSSPQPTPLSTGHSLSAPPSDESVEPSGPYPELLGCLMYLMTCTRPDLAYPLSLLACYVAPGRLRKVHWDDAKRVLRYLCSTSGMGLVLGGRGPVVLTGHADASWAEIYAGAMAVHELRWFTYLLTDLGEQPRLPPVLYVDNKAMIALCQEHRQEHITKHIALRYFLARELQQRGQLRLAYVATRANTADIFTKALQSGDHQRFSTVLGLAYGADYNETYAPVSSYDMLRIFLSIVAVLNLNLMQLDMKNAFLQSKLDRVLYIYQPDYFNDRTGRKKSQVDMALYFKVGDDKVACWVLVYINDLLAASSSAAMLEELKELLESAFELREISPVQKYLGLEIVRDRSARKLWLHQQGYADKLRRQFLDKEQTGCTPKTPVSVDAYAELTFDDEEAQERHEEEYRQKFGSLQFAATTRRPDIAFACSKLGSSLRVRSNQHWREVDRCLAYLANTRDTALEFGGGPESLKLVGYVDADNASDKQNRTSTGGYVFVYGGAAVSWSSQRIKCATLSSTESEYVAATEAGKEGRRLPFLLAEFRQLDAD